MRRATSSRRKRRVKLFRPPWSATDSRRFKSWSRFRQGTRYMLTIGQNPSNAAKVTLYRRAESGLERGRRSGQRRCHRDFLDGRVDR